MMNLKRIETHLTQSIPTPPPPHWGNGVGAKTVSESSSFFIYYLAAPQPTCSHYRGTVSLSQC